MLQELKVDKFCLDLALQSILLGYHTIVAYPPEGRGGLALLIHQDFAMTAYVTIPGGSVAWAHIKGALGDFHIASIYGAGSSTDRSNL